MPGAVDTMNALLAPIIAHASRASQTVAIRADAVEVTYAGLLAASARFAAAIDQLGIGPDDVVALEARRSPETIALILAIAANGAAYLPLDPEQSDARLAVMLGDARPRLCIGDASLRARLPLATRWVGLDELVSTQAVLQLRRSGALAYVLFTSGSTGAPKGVAMRTGAVTALIDWHRQHARLGQAARTLQFAPLGFDVSFQEIFSTLATGGTLVLPSEAERRDPWALLALLERERVERAFLPVVALHALADAAVSARQTAPAALADVVTAGEQLRITPALRAFFRTLPDCVLHNHYGPTETHVVTAHELRAPAAAWPELPPIGMPLPHVLVRVQPLADDAGAGELLLGGGCLAAGYVGRPELSAERFIELEGQRWYRTGDRVRRSGDELVYAGRLDDQVKVDGKRVEPGEIEAVLCRHDDVAQAAVVATGGGASQHLVAHVIARDPAVPETVLQRALEGHCGSALPAWMRPQAFRFHAMLPATASGKIDRRALANSDARPAVHWPGEAPLETQLRCLWEGLLGTRLQPGENLFDAGARSLTVVHALTELRRRGHVMSVADVYEHPTIAAQAALLVASHAPRRHPDGAAARRERQRAAFARFAGPGARS